MLISHRIDVHAALHLSGGMAKDRVKRQAITVANGRLSYLTAYAQDHDLFAYATVCICKSSRTGADAHARSFVGSKETVNADIFNCFFEMCIISRRSERRGC